VRTHEIGFAGFLVVLAALYAGTALRMPRGDLTYPGPGFFPAAVGIFFVLAALGCLAQAVLSRPSPAPASEGATNRLAAGTVQLLVGLVCYGVLLRWLGFPVAILLFSVLAIRIFGYRRWLPVGIIALLLTAVSYVVFVLWLKVPLPMGLVGALLD